MACIITVYRKILSIQKVMNSYCLSNLFIRKWSFSSTVLYSLPLLMILFFFVSTKKTPEVKKCFRKLSPISKWFDTIHMFSIVSLLSQFSHVGANPSKIHQSQFFFEISNFLVGASKIHQVNFFWKIINFLVGAEAGPIFLLVRDQLNYPIIQLIILMLTEVSKKSFYAIFLFLFLFDSILVCV